MKYNKEILNRFLIEKVAIAVRTCEEWDKFMCLLEEETDVEWQLGQKPTEINIWYNYGGNSAITCGYGQKAKLGFSTTNYYKEEGYKIIEFKELVKTEEERKKMTNKRAVITLNEFILNRATDEELPILREAMSVLRENSEKWLEIEEDIENVPWLELVEYLEKHE